MTPDRRTIFREIFMAQYLQSRAEIGMPVSSEWERQEVGSIANGVIAALEQWETDRRRQTIGMIGLLPVVALVAAGALILWKVLF